MYSTSVLQPLPIFYKIRGPAMFNTRIPYSRKTVRAKLGARRVLRWEAAWALVYPDTDCMGWVWAAIDTVNMHFVSCLRTVDLHVLLLYTFVAAMKRPYLFSIG